MTTFQKLIIIVLILFVGISGFYLYRQEQIKKDELEFQKTQKEISDCKYLLANHDLLMKDEEENIKLFNPGPSSNLNEKEQQVWNKVVDEWKKAADDYAASSDHCRNFLRNLPDSDIKF